jgi:DNA-binding MarR family transcriptional regulator/GNAT superfamily N-acetyltransferase
MIADVRSFNRTVGTHIGALSDRFLGGDRPYGQARFLWEIGTDAADVRELRERLGLDSGYVSRLLRSLEADGLLTVEPSAFDRRMRVVRLTRRGLAERAELDQRSDELAASLLAPLSAPQQERLVSAMRDVERLLTASVVEMRSVDPEHPDAVRCLEAYYAELNRRSGGQFDPAGGSFVDPDEMRPPAGVLLVAYLRGDPIGCGALKDFKGEPSYLKRMWVADRVRGLGVGRRLLHALEEYAAARDVRVTRLETNHLLTEAIDLYRSEGYVEVEPFSVEPFSHHWFEKRL